jgi:hypothetical protein
MTPPTTVSRQRPPRLIHDDRWPADRPFIVLSPQHPGDGRPGAAEIDAFVSFALASYDVDEHRIYLTASAAGPSAPGPISSSTGANACLQRC